MASPKTSYTGLLPVPSAESGSFGFASSSKRYPDINASTEDLVILPSEGKRAKKMTREPALVFGTSSMQQPNSDEAVAYASSEGDYAASHLLHPSGSSSSNADTEQLPVLPPKGGTMGGRAPGKIAYESTSAKRQVEAKHSLDLDSLSAALPELDSTITVQLLSGRVVWRSSQSGEIKRPPSVYDIKRALAIELEANLKTRLPLMKLFSSDDLDRFHASTSVGVTAPKPLPNNVVVPAGSRLTLGRVAEENEVDDMDAILQGMAIGPTQKAKNSADKELGSMFQDMNL